VTLDPYCAIALARTPDGQINLETLQPAKPEFRVKFDFPGRVCAA